MVDKWPTTHFLSIYRTRKDQIGAPILYCIINIYMVSDRCIGSKHADTYLRVSNK